tara:strand:- start:973 stop:3687 length:2715 start_codon:yes stop_codon:yes gene_type:complete
MQVSNDKIINPLLKNKFEVESEDSIIELSSSNITKFFSKFYILVPMKNDYIGDEINFLEIDKDLYKNLENKLVIEETNLRALNNMDLNHNLSVVLSKDFEIFNHFGYDLEEKILISPIFSISYKNIKCFLKVYEGLSNLEDLYKIFFINERLKQVTNKHESDFGSIGNNNIINLITNLNESIYWTRKFNCLLNISKQFLSRDFRLYLTRNLKDKEAIDAIKSLESDNKINDYLDKIFSSKNFIDASSCLNKNGFRLYSISKASDFSKKDINLLFDKLSNCQKFFLFSNLMVSKKYCHLIVNNCEILERSKSITRAYAELFRYLLGYCWVRFYLEECIKKSWITKDDDFIFDINTASKLPVYPFSIENPKMNPYFTLLVNDKHIQKNNVGGFCFYNSSEDYRNQGIVDLDGFKRRLNIFMTGNSSNNIFSGIDWEDMTMAISGSVMTACLQKRHPLMELVKGKNSFENTSEFDLDYMRFFNEYYPEADLDVMIKSSHPIDFVRKVNNIFNLVVVNICSFNPTNVEPDHIKCQFYKTVYLFVSENFIRENIVTEEFNYDFIIDNIAESNVIQLFEPYYKKKCEEFYNDLLAEYSSNEIENIKGDFPEIFDRNIVDYQVHVKKPTFKKNDSNEEQDTEDSDSVSKKGDLNVNITFKAKIRTSHIMRLLELFPIFGDDFFSLVSKFHLPCVRSYFDGNDVYLTPSCISAHMTYVNLDYKYFAGSNDQMKIILKYRMRGFGTILNKNEIDKIIKYIKKVNFWSRLYDIQLEDKETIKSILGSVTYKHKLFQPRLYNADLFGEEIPFVNISDGYNDIPNLEIISDREQMEKYINSVLGGHSFKCFNFIDLQTISSDGYVNPLELNKITCAYEELKEYFKEEKTKKGKKSSPVKSNIWDFEEEALDSSDEQ